MKKLLLLIVIVAIGPLFAMAPPPPGWDFTIKNNTDCDYEYLAKFKDSGTNYYQDVGSVPSHGDVIIQVPAGYSFYHLRVYDGAGGGTDANVNTTTTNDDVGNCFGSGVDIVVVNPGFTDASINN